MLGEPWHVEAKLLWKFYQSHKYWSRDIPKLCLIFNIPYRYGNESKIFTSIWKICASKYRRLASFSNCFQQIQAIKASYINDLFCAFRHPTEISEAHEYLIDPRGDVPIQNLFCQTTLEYGTLRLDKLAIRKLKRRFESACRHSDGRISLEPFLCRIYIP